MNCEETVASPIRERAKLYVPLCNKIKYSQFQFAVSVAKEDIFCMIHAERMFVSL